jgi:hypothetical protein
MGQPVPSRYKSVSCTALYHEGVAYLEQWDWLIARRRSSPRQGDQPMVPAPVSAGFQPRLQHVTALGSSVAP